MISPNFDITNFLRILSIMNKLNPTVFLDIDGVITTVEEYNRSRRKYWDKYDTAKNLIVPYPFNKLCVSIFNEILSITGADIVLTSDWRNKWTIEELDIIFKMNGVIKSPIDKTENFYTSMKNLDSDRAREIEEYIARKNITEYVIIDDLKLKPFLTDDSRFVKTIEREGLKQCSIKNKILKVLQS